jgi:nucleoside-diphosphate-sugar epimerase
VSEPILVTGAAGFIDYHVARRLPEQRRAVVRVSAHFDPALKPCAAGPRSRAAAHQDEIG